MNKGKSILFTLSFLALILVVLGGVSATTLNVNPAANAIINGANRLVALQNPNGSWDWVVTGATGPTSITYLNIAGITAEGLLNAYQLTGNQSYLTAAHKTGDYLISQYGGDGSSATNFGGSARINSNNIKFLYDLGKLSGNNSYTVLANALMNKVITAYPTGLDLVNADISYRGIGNGNGIIPWDLYHYIEDAKDLGNFAWATDLANAIKVNSPLSINATSDVTYLIGLSGMTIAGNTDAISALIANQSGDGSWNDPNGQVQDTAYSILALSGDKAIKGSIYLINTQSVANGGWVDNSVGGGSSEISEVDSEAIQAIFSTIPPSVYASPLTNVYPTIQSAINAANSGSTILIAPGIYNENLNVNKGIALAGKSNANTIINGQITVTSNDVSINGFTINNSNGNTGIYVNGASDINITGNIISNIGTTLTTGSAQAIYIHGGASPISNFIIKDNMISNIGSLVLTYGTSGSSAKGIFFGDSTGTSQINSVIIQNNSISSIFAGTASWPTPTTKIGYGAGAYGILINYGKSTGSTSGLQITNNQISNLEGLWAHAIGLEGNTPTATVTGNIISNLIDHKTLSSDATAINLEDNPSISTIQISQNSFSHLSIGIQNAVSLSLQVNAKNNFWGVNNNTLISQMINGNVSYSPWYTSSDMRTFGFTTNPDSGGNPAVTLPAMNLISNDSSNISVEIPNGVTVTGDSSWDGTILPPTLELQSSGVSNLLPLQNSFEVAALTGTRSSLAGFKIFEVGSVISNLTFSNFVNITLPGAVDLNNYYGVGYIKNNNYYEIHLCDSNNPSNSNALPSGNDCYYVSGSDIIIRTNHFTQFVVYTTTPNTVSGPGVTPVAFGGGGGGASPAATTSTNTNASTNTSSPLFNASNPNSLASTPSGTSPLTGNAVNNAPITGGVIGALTSTWGIIVIVLLIVVLIVGISVSRSSGKNKSRMEKYGY